MSAAGPIRDRYFVGRDVCVWYCGDGIAGLPFFGIRLCEADVPRQVHFVPPTEFRGFAEIRLMARAMQ